MGNCIGTERCESAEVPTTTLSTECVALSIVFIKVPFMLESCLHTALTRIADIGALRLVNKDMASMALRAVRSCKVQLGEGAVPDPQFMTWLRSCALLENMHLTLIIQAGR